MMTSQILPTGMVTTSPTNPSDQIPVGPQIFPFGTPTVEESQINPYQSTNYAQGLTTQVQTSVLPDTTYQTVGADASTYVTQYQASDALAGVNYDASALGQVQTVDALAGVNYDTAALGQVQTVDALAGANYDAAALGQYQVAEAGAYDLGAYQAAAAGEYQAAQVGQVAPAGYTYRTVMKPVVKTGYQTVVKYKPVTKTQYVPRLTTKYVPVDQAQALSAVQGVSAVQGSLNPALSAQSLALSQTTPLAASALQTPGVAVAPQPLAMTTPMPLAASTMPLTTPAPVAIGGDNHFVSNYPIYENDPRRLGGAIF
jgi:hypothetical protein